jgi:hypothetical protein
MAPRDEEVSDAADLDFWKAVLARGLVGVPGAAEAAVEDPEEGAGVEGREGTGVVLSLSSNSFFSA